MQVKYFIFIFSIIFKLHLFHVFNKLFFFSFTYCAHKLFFFFHFTMLYWFCHTSTWIHHGYTRVPNLITPLPPPSPYHPSGSSQCSSPKHPVSCIEPGLVICFLSDIIHVSKSFSQIIPPSPSPTESKKVFYTSLPLLLSRIQDLSVNIICLFL